MSKYGNLNTLEITDTKPTQIGSTWNPTNDQLAAAGWRKITATDSPAEGYRATEYGLEETGLYTCKRTIVASVNIADEAAAAQAAAEAAEAAAKAEAAEKVTVSRLDLLEVIVRIHNLNLPAQNKVSKAEAMTIVSGVVYE